MSTVHVPSKLPKLSPIPWLEESLVCRSWLPISEHTATSNGLGGVEIITWYFKGQAPMKGNSGTCHHGLIHWGETKWPTFHRRHIQMHFLTWWRHQMETFSALLALCVGNSPVPGEFPAQRPVTRNFDVFFDLCLNKWLSKQTWGWRFETPSSPLWCHCNERKHKNFYHYSLNFIPKGQIKNIAALVQIMAWYWPSHKPLSEPMMVSLLMQISITWPQWVNGVKSYSILLQGWILHVHLRVYKNFKFIVQKETVYFVLCLHWSYCIDKNKICFAFNLWELCDTWWTGIDRPRVHSYFMMMSSHGNIFRITGHLCSLVTGEFPAQRPVTRSFEVFFLSAPE